MTRLTGKIIRWDSDRGFGFVRADDNFDGARGDVFCHVSSLPTDKLANVGDGVSFEIKETYRGLRAVDVELLK